MGRVESKASEPHGCIASLVLAEAWPGHSELSAVEALCCLSPGGKVGAQRGEYSIHDSVSKRQVKQKHLMEKELWAAFLFIINLNIVTDLRYLLNLKVIVYIGF